MRARVSFSPIVRVRSTTRFDARDKEIDARARLGDRIIVFSGFIFRFRGSAPSLANPRGENTGESMVRTFAFTPYRTEKPAEVSSTADLRGEGGGFNETWIRETSRVMSRTNATRRTAGTTSSDPVHTRFSSNERALFLFVGSLKMTSHAYTDSPRGSVGF